MTAVELDLTTPDGEPVALWRTLISHGFASLAPMDLDEERRSLALTVRVARARPRRVRIAEAGPTRARVEVLGPRPGPARGGCARTASRGTTATSTPPPPPRPPGRRPARR